MIKVSKVRISGHTTRRHEFMTHRGDRGWAKAGKQIALEMAQERNVVPVAAGRKLAKLR